MPGVKFTDEQYKEAFLKKIRINDDGCWIWTGARKEKRQDSHGYTRYKGNTVASRVSYVLFVGEIPDGMYVCHRCDVRPCVNPEHLFIGTQKDNMQDCSAKGRTSKHRANLTHCASGHEFTKENTYHPPKRKHTRHCRECQRLRSLGR